MITNMPSNYKPNSMAVSACSSVKSCLTRATM